MKTWARRSIVILTPVGMAVGLWIVTRPDISTHAPATAPTELEVSALRLEIGPQLTEYAERDGSALDAIVVMAAGGKGAPLAGALMRQRQKCSFSVQGPSARVTCARGVSVKP